MVQNMLKGLTHMGKKRLTLRHLKVLMGVELMVLITKGKAFPKDSEIAGLIGVAPEDFQSELRDLVELRYLHEIMPTFGAMIMRYKLGSMGGTLMRQMLAKVKPADKPIDVLPPRLIVPGEDVD